MPMTSKSVFLTFALFAVVAGLLYWVLFGSKPADRSDPAKDQVRGKVLSVSADQENRPTPYLPETQKKMLEVAEPEGLSQEKKRVEGFVSSADFIWKHRSGKVIYYHLDIETKELKIRDGETGAFTSHCQFDETTFKQVESLLAQIKSVCEYDYYKRGGAPCSPARFPAWLVLNWSKGSEVRFGERSDHCALDVQPCGLKLQNQLKVAAQNLMSSASCR